MSIKEYIVPIAYCLLLKQIPTACSSCTVAMLPIWNFDEGIFDFSEGTPRRLTTGRLFGIVADRICSQIDLGPQLAQPTEVVLSRPSGDGYLSQDPSAASRDLVAACRVLLQPEFAGAALELVLDGVATLGHLGFLVQRGGHRHRHSYFETDLVAWRPRPRTAWSCELKTTVLSDLRYSSRLRTSRLRSQLQTEGCWAGHVILVAHLDWPAGAVAPVRWRFAAECIEEKQFCNSSLDVAWAPLCGYSSAQALAPLDVDGLLERTATAIQLELQAGLIAGKLRVPRDRTPEAAAAAHRDLLHRVGVLSGESRHEAIAKALSEGDSALLRCSATDALSALCTVCGLLSPPRKLNDPAAPAVASATRHAVDVYPSLQSELRSLVAKLLSAFDLDADREYFREPVDKLNSLIEKISLDQAARAIEWHRITDALGPSVSVAAKREPGGGSTAGMQEQRRIEKRRDLSMEGSWRACKKCARGGRYVTNVDIPLTALRQCWAKGCKAQTSVQAWRKRPGMVQADAQSLELDING